MKCKLRSIWYTLSTPSSWLTPVRFSGHRFGQSKTYQEGGELVEHMVCADCGYIDKAYWERP